ncbi:MAG: hypothetical protein AAF355_06410 [Myxococcota bacterium]
MFFRKAALRPVPGWAVVNEHALDSLELGLEEGSESLQNILDKGYRDLDRRQPSVGLWLAEEVSKIEDELVQSLGYFLVVAVYLAFREAFPRRLHEVDQEGLRLAEDTLDADIELRAQDPLEVLDTDDVVRLAQPALLRFIQHHMQEAVEQSTEDVDLDELDRLYHTILVEVVALSHAVASPTGEVGPPREALA